MTGRAQPPPGPLVVLEDVHTGTDGEHHPLKGVSLAIDRGAIVAVTALGLHGGRSTLLQVASGLLEPTAGRVRFDGEDVYRMPHAATQRLRARVGVVLEQTGLLANTTIWENVALPLRYHGGLGGRELKQRVERLLHQAGFAEDPHALPWRISMRGRRLAAFARALARDPSLVVVDGFFEGLEMPDWRRLFEVVTELNRQEGVTWLLACEIDPIIFSLADQVAVLDHGRLAGFGRRRELFQDPRIERAFHEADASTLRRKSARWTSLRTPVSQELLLDAMETIAVDGRLTEVRPAEETSIGDPDATIVQRPPGEDPLETINIARPPRDALGTPSRGARRFAEPATAEPPRERPPTADWEREILAAAREALEASGAAPPREGAGSYTPTARVARAEEVRAEAEPPAASGEGGAKPQDVALRPGEPAAPPGEPRQP